MIAHFMGVIYIWEPYLQKYGRDWGQQHNWLKVKNLEFFFATEHYGCLITLLQDRIISSYRCLREAVGKPCIEI